MTADGCQESMLQVIVPRFWEWSSLPLHCHRLSSILTSDVSTFKGLLHRCWEYARADVRKGILSLANRFVFLSVCLYVCLLVCLLECFVCVLYVCLFACLFVCLCLYVCLYGCLLVCFYVWLYVCVCCCFLVFVVQFFVCIFYDSPLSPPHH